MASAAVQQRLITNPTPQPSQNTAPVLEFRCLFTHDIFKKQKKWHDGSLRFHTFNKRVMVYDDSKNFIGDLHYRQADEFGEGLEFQLDKPVKIVVEEQLGETRTDLAPLLGKARPDDQNQTAVPPSVRSADTRLNPANTQGRPKSIKELLGASQARFGRSMLPPRSPFEQRQALAEKNQSEPSPKRQKLASGKENSVEIALPKVTLAQTRRQYPEESSFRLTSASIAQPAGPTIEREVIDLSSQNGTTNSQDRPSGSSSTRQKAKTRETAARKALNDPNAISAILGISPPSARSKKSKKKIVRPDLRSVQEHQFNLEQEARTSASSKLQEKTRSEAISASSTPRSSLTFGAFNPRRKLLYKALLPGSDGLRQETGPATDVGTKPPPTNPTQSDKSQAKDESVQSRRATRNKNSIINLDKFFEDLVNEEPAAVPDESASNIVDEPTTDDLPTYQSGEFAQEKSDVEPLAIGSSPLFVSQNESQISQSAPDSVPEDNLLVCSPSRSTLTTHFDPDAQERSARSENYLQARDGNQSGTIDMPTEVTETAFPLDAVVESLPIVEHHESADANQPAAAQDRSDEPLPRPVSGALSTLQTSPVSLGSLRQINPVSGTAFRRIRSENDADADFDLVDPFANDSIIADRRSCLLQKPIQPATTILQRTLSDTALITQQETPTMIKSVEHVAKKRLDMEEAITIDIPPSDGDTGPWTSTEAFLLFDWWPEGKRRNKPEYGQSESITTNDTGPFSRNNQPAVPLGVESRKYGMFGSARFVSQR